MEPETIILGVMLCGISIYALMGGADFGAGVWEFNTGFRASEKERDMIHKAIGPVWEANHVWLIFAVILMFGAFPVWYAGLCRALYVPLIIALVGIVFRGAAFAFRAYSGEAKKQKRAWEVVFALASIVAPMFLGASAGAIASGQLIVGPDGSYAGDPLRDWISPTSIFCAFLAPGLCAYMAAVFLCKEAQANGQVDMLEMWRKRGLAVGAVTGTLSMAGLPVIAYDAPLLWEGFLDHSLFLVLASAVGGIGSVFALWFRKYTLAVPASALATGSVIWGWAFAQGDMLIPPGMSIADAKAPDAAMWVVIWVVGAGVVFLMPALGYLLYMFKSEHESMS